MEAGVLPVRNGGRKEASVPRPHWVSVPSSPTGPHLVSVGVLISQGFCNKVPQTGFSYLTILEVRCPKSRYGQCHVPSETCRGILPCLFLALLVCKPFLVQWHKANVKSSVWFLEIFTQCFLKIDIVR